MDGVGKRTVGRLFREIKKKIKKTIHPQNAKTNTKIA
jgi:Holliday junction resolvasome RuvABC DNA-binding subunit